jgi:uncharacterized protein
MPTSSKKTPANSKAPTNVKTPANTKTPADPTIDSPWYQAGLAFQCTGCGDCCTGEPGYVWVIQSEIDALATALGIDAAAFQAKFVRQVGQRKSLIERANGDCVFFDNRARHCTVYDSRPRQCRTFPFWQSNLRSESIWRDLCAACPGMGRGRVVPLAQIEAKLATVRV